MAESVLGLIEFLLPGGGVAEIKPEIGLYRRIVDLAEYAQILLGRAVIFLVVIFHPEPLENFRRNVSGRVGGKESVDFLGHRGAIVQPKIRGNDSNSGGRVIAVLVQLARSI